MTIKNITNLVIFFLVFSLLAFSADITSGNAYVDTDLGTDDTSHGGSSGSGACKTLAYLMTSRIGNPTAAITIHCAGATADGPAVVDKSTATYAITIQVDTPHPGYYDTTKYHIVATTGSGITLSTDKANIIGLQIYLNHNGNGKAIWAYSTAATDYQISKCFIQGDGVTTSGDQYGIYVSDGGVGSTTKIWNNVFCHFTNTASNDAAGVRIGATNHTASIYSNTIHNCRWGVYRSAGTVTLKNNLFDSNVTLDVNGTVTDTYCATTNNNTKGLAAAGTGNRFSQTFSYEAGTHYFKLTNADAGARTYGVDTSGESAPLNFTTDIIGTSRTTWDIGAFKATASAGGPVMPVFMHYYQLMSFLFFDYLGSFKQALA